MNEVEEMQPRAYTREEVKASRSTRPFFQYFSKQSQQHWLYFAATLGCLDGIIYQNDL